MIFFSILYCNYSKCVVDLLYKNLNRQRQQKRPDRAIYIVPRGRRSQTTQHTAQTSNSGAASKTEISERESANVISSSHPPISPSQKSGTFELKSQDLLIDTKELIVHEEIADEPNLKPQSIAIQAEIPSEFKHNMDDANIKCEGNKIDIDDALDTSDKDYNEEKEFQRASKVHHLLNNPLTRALFIFVLIFIYF